MPRDYRKLKVFQLADDLVADIYRSTNGFPKSETFGLSSQMRRAAVSVPANIVEGCFRRSQKDYLQSLNIALGSLAELGYYISLSYKLGFLNKKEHDDLIEKHGHCMRAMQGLVRPFKKES